ncbi:L-gulonolactone/D-arabinono-1,4-lactone oxidase [Daedalea quercina L-15889]|uniref:D-arabinono-1,4-lactone oxidase n=1 Tax=Daedalea quercina L-15889 TaxID=1314783 RepID=A0A165NB20_9APHY|nr:L-gulonolactone/D-arabinono-1,4-lactone oxidase [Daedalea quercina L-15889]
MASSSSSSPPPPPPLHHNVHDHDVHDRRPRPDTLPLDVLYALLEPITVPATHPRASFVNWGLTYACTPLAVFEPASPYQCELVFELARRERKTVRATGVGHSPSDLACTSGYMLRTEKLNKIIEVRLFSSFLSGSPRPFFAPLRPSRSCHGGEIPVLRSGLPASFDLSLSFPLSIYPPGTATVNAEKRYIVAQGGVTLNAVHAALAAHGLAMTNLGSISDQTLAGMVTTSTHGSGIDFQVLSTHVRSLLLLLPDGARARCSRDAAPDLFMASLCGLGSTGLILEVTLQVEPAFRLRETQESLPFDDVLDRFDDLVHAAEHVRFWWFPAAGVVRVSAANRTDEPKRPVSTWLWHSLLGFHLLQLLLFLGRFLPPLVPLIGRFAAWLVSNKTVAVDDSYRIFNVDCKYPQYTTEWAIPYAHAPSCLREMRDWLEREHADPHGLRPHFPIEIRFTDADDIWLSPSSGGKTCWIGIVQYKPYGCTVPYRKLFERYERIVARYGGRPHWAKAHHFRPDDLRRLYPRFDDFIRVLEDVDPRGMLRNEYVNRHLFGAQGPEFGERVFKLKPQS